MKISGYYKSIGYDVELIEDYDAVKEYDRVFLSKVFTDTPVQDDVLLLPTVEYGGTGFYYDKAKPLPSEIEHCMPDYHLYDNWVAKRIAEGASKQSLIYYTHYSIGFMTRGCIRQCSFCVNKNYQKCSLHSPVEEFVDESRPYICLLDDNILACPQWEDAFAALNGTQKRFQFKQGLDERLLTDKKCEVLFSSLWIGDYIFAFDNIKDEKLITKKLAMLRRHMDKRCKFYTFCAFNHDKPDTYPDDFCGKDIDDLFRRIVILAEYQCSPYIMRYKDYEILPHRGMYIALASWCNQPGIFKRMSFRSFCEARADRKRYMDAFELDYPDVANKYFDWKYEDKEKLHASA